MKKCERYMDRWEDGERKRGMECVREYYKERVERRQRKK
jgi:hypothetical protein